MSDRLARLVILRDQLTTRLAGDVADRDFASLSLRLTDVLNQIEACEAAAPQTKGTVQDEVARQREARAAARSAGAAKRRV